MIESYESFNSDPFTLKENSMAKLGIKEFSNLFDNSIFESSSDTLLLEKAYSTYELGLLYENRKDWFDDEDQIYVIESDEYNLLFKNDSLFFVSDSTLKMIKEGWSWSDATEAWNKIKLVASSEINRIKSAASKTWDTISNGAKKVWEFSKRITSAAVEFAKSDPLTCSAIFLQLLSAIVAFIPAAGQAIGPFCLALAGIIEVYVGTTKMTKAWKKLSNMDIANHGKSIAAFSEGAPYLVAGSVSILLGLNDVITAPKAALPGAGATSTALRAIASKWSSNFAGRMAHNAEHFVVDIAGKGAAKIGPALAAPAAKFMGKGGSALAATAVTTLMLKIGKSILGSLFDTVLIGMGSISTSLSYVLSLPTKASEMLDKLINGAESPIAKVLIAPLKTIINPVVKFLGKLLDTYIKPMSDGLTEYLKAVVKNHRAIEAYSDKIKVENTTPLVKSEISKIKSKNAEVSKDDLKKIKKIKKSMKKNESLVHIHGFDSFLE